MKMAEPKSITAMGLKPEDVISFGGGWVNHRAPVEMQDLYVEICKNTEDFHKSGAYSLTTGSIDCRLQLARFEEKIFGLRGLTEKNIIIGQSSTQITRDVFVTVADPSDTILLLDPTYANYAGQIAFALPHAKIKYLRVLDPETWEYMPNVGNLIEKFKKIYQKIKPKVVLVPSPDNPTGQIPKEEFVKAVLDITSDGNTFLAIDSAYKTQYFSENPPKYYSWSPVEHENLIALHSNSKWARGLGRRLGWIEASENVIDGMERTQQCTILCPDTLHQMAITAYLKKSLDDNSLKNYLDKTRAEYKRAAEVTINAIDKYLGLPRLVPQGGLYTVIKVCMDGDKFVMDVLKNTAVLFIPGKGFGESLREGVRLSYGPWVDNTRKIEEGLRKAGEYLQKKHR
jgi:aspartate/methionine/tyrosine aminotransferase